MKIEKIEIEKINIAPYNPRKDLKPGDPEYESLKRSIETWGYVDPLVWNKQSGNLVGGHQRFKILLERGDKTVDVSVVDIDDRHEKALNVALNKISGAWDFPKLSELIMSLDTGDFDLTLTGFSMVEIENMATWKSLDKNSNKEWDGMPEFNNIDKGSFKHVIVHFKDEQDFESFFNKLEYDFTTDTKSIWFPPQENMDTKSKTY